MEDLSDVRIVDLGDAMRETKQCAPAAFVPDSTFQWGTHSWPPYPGQCEGPWGDTDDRPPVEELEEDL